MKKGEILAGGHGIYTLVFCVDQIEYWRSVECLRQELFYIVIMQIKTKSYCVLVQYFHCKVSFSNSFSISGLRSDQVA